MNETVCQDVIAEWAEGKQLAGVVWTALPPKQGAVEKVPTQEEVVRHLGNLAGAFRAGAEEYVRKAPKQVRTPYRHAIEQALDWKPID